MSDVQLINGDLPASTRHIDGVSLTVQRAQIRVGTFLGEWIFDTADGFPYFEWLQIKPPPLDEIGAFLRSELDDTPGVLRVDRVAVTFTPDTETIRAEADVVVADDVTGDTATARLSIDIDRNASPYVTAIMYASGGVVP